jgi:hypothetical protein
VAGTHLADGKGAPRAIVEPDQNRRQIFDGDVNELEVSIT